MKLSELETNKEGIIAKIQGRGAFRKRIMEMGFVKGKRIKVIKNAPLKDPIEYNIMGYEVSLRRSEASLIEIITPEEVTEEEADQYLVSESSRVFRKTLRSKEKTINVALVGNPNCGKTSLFNSITGLKEHVGNYSGVTVDVKLGQYKMNGYTFNIYDLPGTYSLTAYSPEEIFVRDHILNESPDVVLNIIDSSNLERNLYLTTQLIDMDVKLVAALNMYDELEKNNDFLDYVRLGRLTGIPYVPTIGTRGKGIKELLQTVIDVFEDKHPTEKHIHINYGEVLECSIQHLQDLIWQNKSLTDRISSRFIAIKLLEKDGNIKKYLDSCENKNEILSILDKEITTIEKEFHEESDTRITDLRYGFINGALRRTFRGNFNYKILRSYRIDNILTHKYLGIPVFFFLMWLMFHFTFTLGSYPMDLIDAGINGLSGLVERIMNEGPLKDLLINGIIDGVGGVILFLPNILILFFFISLMEDTGYMARAAFIMDKLMHKIGLHGQSFIPLLMGFGCNVPAIMATRTIKDRKSRILTILINPLMSCSARLPVYVLLISAFFPGYRSLVLFSIYFTGILLAVIIALIFKRILFRHRDLPFVLELPPYRIPTTRNIVKHMWNKSNEYLKKIAGVIVLATIFIWALEYYPQNIDFSKDYNRIIIEKQERISNITHEASLMQAEKETIILKIQDSISLLEQDKIYEQKEKSYIGIIGNFISPVIEPLGFDWRMGISLMAGIAAKEIVISTMAVLYHANEDDRSGNNLIKELQQATMKDSAGIRYPVFSPLKAFSFMIFLLIYFPCIGVIATIKNETGSWKWALFTIFYTSALAWIVSFSIYRVGLLF